MSGFVGDLMAFKYPMKMLKMHRVLECTRFPRSTEVAESDYVDLVRLEEVGLKRDECFIVFVSHRWWAGEDENPHPDTSDDLKLKIVQHSLQKLHAALAGQGHSLTILVWLDFFSIDQEDRENQKKGIDSLPAYIKNSDALITPYHLRDVRGKGESACDCQDPLDHIWHNKWTAPILQLKNHEHEYFGRAWCRLEMYLGSNAALPADVPGYFQRLGSHRAGRPHFLVGNRDGEDVDSPTDITLEAVPHLSNSFFKRLDPTKGALKCDSDMHHIRQIMEVNPMDEVQVGYQGDLDSEGLEHGYGTYQFDDGSCYEGQYVHGERQGPGKYFYAGGARYEGDWVHGKKHGLGKYFNANGTRYEGEFRDGERHGHGKYFYDNGDRYEGGFRNGVSHGRGTEYNTDGSRYEGHWANDSKNGHGKYFGAGGSLRYEGDYQDGKRNGEGKSYHANGTLQYEGGYRDDKRNGEGKSYHANGNLKYYGDWVKGKRHGHGKSYHSDGSVKYDGDWADDKRHGRGAQISSSGARTEGVWEKGQKL